jgi:uncharacterized protein (TIRG00374 family)
VIFNHDLGELFRGLASGHYEAIFNPDLHLDEMEETFRRVDSLPLVLAAIVSVLLLVIRAIRWRYLLLPRAEVRFNSLLSATMIGFMANNVLPARAGEFVRAYVLSKKEAVSISAVLGTLVVERFFDVLSLLLMFSLTYHFSSQPSWVQSIGVVATIVFFVFLALLLFAVVRPGRFVAVLSRWSRIVPGGFHERIEGILESFLEGLGIFRYRKLLLVVFLLSALHWLAFGWALSLGLRGFGITVPPEGPYLVLSVVSLSLAIPSSPGFVGTFQWFMVKSLSLYRVPENLSLPFSIGFHLILYIPTTTIGLIYFFRENISWREVKQSDDLVGEAEGGRK